MSRKINWRQILIHFLASLFFMYAMKTIMLLYDVELIELEDRIKDINWFLRIRQTKSSDEIFNYILWTSIGGAIGIFISFIISLIISLRKKWFWLNSLIAFAIIFILRRTARIESDYSDYSNFLPGHFFSIKTEIILNSTLLIIMGILIFTSKLSNKLIQDGLKP